MAENAPPGSTSNASADTSRGVPYYERLRRDLRESLNKKRLIDNNLVSTMYKKILQRATDPTHSCNLKRTSSVLRHNTSRKPVLGTSSRASTTTSKAQLQQRQLVAQARQRGGKHLLAMWTGYSAEAQAAF